MTGEGKYVHNDNDADRMVRNTLTKLWTRMQEDHVHMKQAYQLNCQKLGKYQVLLFHFISTLNFLIKVVAFAHA